MQGVTPTEARALIERLALAATTWRHAPIIGRPTVEAEAQELALCESVDAIGAAGGLDAVLAALVAEAVAGERKRCAGIARHFLGHGLADGPWRLTQDVAATIESASDTTQKGSP